MDLALIGYLALAAGACAYARSLWRTRISGSLAGGRPGRSDWVVFLIVLTALPALMLHFAQRVSVRFDVQPGYSVRLDVQGPPITSENPVSWRYSPAVAGPFEGSKECAAEARRIAREPAEWIPDTMPENSSVARVWCAVDEGHEPVWGITSAAGFAITAMLSVIGFGGRAGWATIALVPGLLLVAAVPSYPPWESMQGRVSFEAPIGLGDYFRDIGVAILALAGAVLYFTLAARSARRKSTAARPSRKG